MKHWIFAFLALAGALAATPAYAQMRTWIVIGDSIQSHVADGSSPSFDLHLVQNERNILFRNLSTPGVAMASYNEALTEQMLDRICGPLSYCDGVIIQAGLNDFALAICTWANVSGAMNRIYAWARARGKKVIVLDLIWATQFESAPANHMGYTFGQYRMSRAVTCALNSDVCSFAGRPTQFNTLTPSLYAASEQASGNHVHPNVAGHRVLADWLKATGTTTGWF